MKTQLSNSETKELMKSLEANYHLKNILNKKDIVVREDNLLKINNKVLFFFYKEGQMEKLIPTLKLIIELCERIKETNSLNEIKNQGETNNIKQTSLKTITVDKGAVKFVVNGADIMRPGITKIDEGIQKGEVVIILEETHQKPISICVSEASSEELKAMTQGRVLTNIHFVGDSVWKSS
ncbi:hypothetical protein HY636_00380 [Candidatus Woesearchaeota archaeon]|nr:hypothetical protein [Candidatus Woesearchaeota archaeon]